MPRDANPRHTYFRRWLPVPHSPAKVQNVHQSSTLRIGVGTRLSMRRPLFRLVRDSRRRRGAWVSLQTATRNCSAVRDASYAPLPIRCSAISFVEVLVVYAKRIHGLVLQKYSGGRFVKKKTVPATGRFFDAVCRGT